jgi:hypothetical protein
MMMFGERSKSALTPQGRRRGEGSVLAHAGPGIKKVYDIHDYLDEKREALELWAKRLRDIVTPTLDNVIKLHATA